MNKGYDTRTDQAESVDLLLDRRTKPLHGHVIADCYFPLSAEDAFWETISGNAGTPTKTSCPPSLPERHEESSSGPKKEPCIIETIPKSRVPAEFPRKPEKPHTTKGDIRKEVEVEPVFAEFAECDTNEKILRFADRFGRLTREKVGLPDSDDPIKFQTVPGEPLRLWQYEAKRMKIALSFWMGDPEYINQRIFFEADASKDFRAVYYTEKPGEPITRIVLASSSDYTQHLLEYLPHGDYAAAAKVIAGTMVTRAMQKHTAQSNILMKSIGKFELRIMPENLLAVIWLSFAEAMTGERAIRRCIVCERLFEVHDETSRMIFHEACRNRIKVKRSRCKEKYSALIKEGTALPDVAAACKVNLKTLEYWLSLDNKQKGESDE